MTQEQEGKRCINSNEILDEKVENAVREYEQLQLQQKKAQMIQEYMENAQTQLDENGEPIHIPLEQIEEELFGDNSQQEEIQKEEVINQAKEEAQQIILEAQKQADEIIEVAQSQAEALKSHAKQEGQKLGYDAGVQQALLDMQQKEEEFLIEKEQVLRELANQQKNMEQDLVPVICDIYEHVFSVNFSQEQDVVYHLLDNMLQNIEGGKLFLVRVNETNAQYLKSRRDELQERIGTEVVLEIISDPVMAEGDCIVETDGGVFDCSFDVELKELTKKIKALSMRG